MTGYKRMEAEKTGKFRKAARNAMLGLAAAAIMGTTGCGVASQTYTTGAAEQTPEVQILEEQTPKVLTIKALPLSVASNCYVAPGGEVCDLATTVQGADGKVYTVEASFLSDEITEMSETTRLESAIQAEIVDGDKDTIELVIRDAWTKPGIQYEYFDKVTVNGITYGGN